MSSQGVSVPIGVSVSNGAVEVAYMDPATLRVRVVPFGGESHCPLAVRFNSETKRVEVGREAYSVRFTRREEVALFSQHDPGNPDFQPITFETQEAEAPQCFGPAEILGEVLKHVRAVTEECGHLSAGEAVFTIPVAEGTLQREHTAKAAEIACLQPLMLLPKPVAALVGCGRVDSPRELLAMVCDFDDGSCECSIVRVVQNRYDIVASVCSHLLGGAGVDELIAAKVFAPEVFVAGFDPESDEPWSRQIRAKMLDEAERSRKVLAEGDEESVPVLLTNLEAPGKERTNLRLRLTQDQLADVIRPLVTGTVHEMQMCLDQAGVDRASLDLILLVGSMAQLSPIKKAVCSFMGEDTGEQEEASMPARVYCDPEPERVVVRGAARVASEYHREERRVQLVSMTRRTLGCQKPGTGEFVPLIPRNTELSGARTSITLRWGRQDAVSLEFYEGESPNCADNRYLGTLKVSPETNLAPGTSVVVEIQYRDVSSVPFFEGRIAGSGEALQVPTLFRTEEAGTASPSEP